MATVADYDLLRADVAATEAQLSDADAEDIFDTVEADYAGDASAIYAAARVLYLRRAWADATNLADYTQNEESERLSQVAAAKKRLLDYWQAELDRAVAKNARAMVFTLGKATGRRWYP